MTAPLLALLLAATADPCQPVEPAPTRDPEAAAAYRRVGDAERAAGAAGTATAAYREALARDPDDQASRAALHALCAGGAVQPDAFREGLARMDEGDFRAAITAFRQARAAAPDPSAALLEGICHYKLGDDDEARPLLREAERTPEHGDAARFYLGLIAMREGASSEAATLFDAAAANSAFAPLALDLARMARREGRLVLTFAADAGWDSNATLAPDGLPLGSDWSGSISAGGLYRPMGESGPYLRATGFYHQQLRIDSLDMGGVSAAAGWQLGRTGKALLAEYDYDYRTLGGSSYLSAHRLLASGWLAVGDVVLSASYFARFESYLSSTYAPFDGFLQGAEVRATLALGQWTRVGLAYRLSHDGVTQPYLSWIEHGPRADLRLQPAPGFRIGIEAALGFRPYRAVDPSFALTRSDTYLDGAALVEYDVADHWTLRLGVEARRALSNIPDYSYTRLAPTLGVVYVLGL